MNKEWSFPQEEVVVEAARPTLIILFLAPGAEGSAVYGYTHPYPHLAKREQHPAPCSLHPTPYTLPPTPNTIHPAPHTPHPTPCTLHPTLCTLHPSPYTLHPYTLHL